MKSSEAIRLMDRLAATYPKTEIKPETIQVYGEMLAELDYEQVCEAVKRISISSKWFPSIAEIREEVLAVPDDGREDEAWAEVLAVVRRVGRDRIPEFSTVAITRAVHAVGWQAICNSTLIGVERAHFTKIYKSALAEEKRKRLLGTVAPDRQERLAPERPERPLLEGFLEKR